MTRALVALLVVALATPARATDCAQLPPIVAGGTVTEEQLRCVQLELAARLHDAETAEARRVEAATLLTACEATGAIACPPPGPPIAEVAIATVIAAALGFIAGLLVGR